MITNWINSIQKSENGILFVGDGFGDFTEFNESASQQAIEAYIEYCYEQIQFATEYLKTLESYDKT